VGSHSEGSSAAAFSSRSQLLEIVGKAQPALIVLQNRRNLRSGRLSTGNTLTRLSAVTLPARGNTVRPMQILSSCRAASRVFRRNRSRFASVANSPTVFNPLPFRVDLARSRCSRRSNVGPIVLSRISTQSKDRQADPIERTVFALGRNLFHL